MKLLIVSHTEHYQENGAVVGWEATVREIDQLALEFDQVVHIAMIYPGPAPESTKAYQSSQVEFRPVPASGGEGLWEKLRILAFIPVYVKAILKELKDANVIHVRCPSNIGLIAIILLALVRTPRIRWIKYAGNWRPGSTEPWSYAFQRWWLNKALHRGIVTVNGQWANQPKFVRSFLNPCLTGEELTEGNSLGAQKELRTPVRLIFVGRIETKKGAGRALNILSELDRSGISATMDLVGDSPDRATFMNLADSLGVSHLTKFHGWLPRSRLALLYAQSHMMILPCNSSEGWPKVLSEGMAYGVVPVAGNVSSIPQYLEYFGTGKAIDPEDVEGYCRVISEYCLNPSVWKLESVRSMRAAASFTYSRYLEDVRVLLRYSANRFASTSH